MKKIQAIFSFCKKQDKGSVKHSSIFFPKTDSHRLDIGKGSAMTVKSQLLLRARPWPLTFIWFLVLLSNSAYTSASNHSEAISFSSVQSLSYVRLFATPWTAAWQASLSITNSWSLLKLMSIESVMPSNHLILCHPLLLPPSIFPSIRVFSNESALHIRWPKYCRFSFSISPSNEYSGLTSFRMDWLDLLAVQGTLKSLLQHHSSKASSELSFLYSPTLTSIHDYWKNHSLD